MSNATFSRKPLVAAVLTTLAVFSAGAMAEPVNKDVTLTVGTAENFTEQTVAGTVQNEQTWNEAWAQKFDKDFKNAEGKVTINGQGQGNDKITISKGADEKASGKLTNSLSRRSTSVLTSLKAARSSTTARSTPTKPSRSRAASTTPRARSKPRRT